MTRVKLVPLRTYPDSSETYNLENLIKVTNPISTLDLTKKQIKDLIEFIVHIRNLRVHEPIKLPLSKHVKIRVDTLAEQILNTKKISIHQRNKLLTSNVSEIVTPHRKRSISKYTITDVILYLLYSTSGKPINGRISITKQIFLIIKEILGEEKVEKSKFIPYKYGPYSFLVTEIISNLQYDGLVQVKGRKNSSSEKFIITERGKKAIEKKFNKLSKSIQNKIIDRRKGWDESHTDGILSYVYDRYPEYTERSKIKHKYKCITWGKAKG